MGEGTTVVGTVVVVVVNSMEGKKWDPGDDGIVLAHFQSLAQYLHTIISDSVLYLHL